MKLKLKLDSITGIILIALMLGSTVSYAFLQSFLPKKKVSLPDKTIIDYKLTVEQEDMAVRLGKTIVTLKYPSNCSFVEECGSLKLFLENFARSYSDQIILEEIESEDFSLRVMSYYGEEESKDFSSEKVLDILCDLMFKPPVMCAAREI